MNHSSPDSAIRPLREDEVIALHDLADKGGLLCDCESNPELCHCSTIMMLCDEWRAMRASVKPDVAQDARPCRELNSIEGRLIQQALVDSGVPVHAAPQATRREVHQITQEEVLDWLNHHCHSYTLNPRDRSHALTRPEQD